MKKTGAVSWRSKEATKYEEEESKQEEEKLKQTEHKKILQAQKGEAKIQKRPASEEDQKCDGFLSKHRLNNTTGRKDGAPSCFVAGAGDI